LSGGRAEFYSRFVFALPRLYRQAAAALPEVCCDEWQKAVKSGRPCNPAKDANCDGNPNNQKPYGDGLNPNTFMDKNKPQYVWVSVPSGVATIGDCAFDLPGAVVPRELNGTMLYVTDLHHFMIGRGDWYSVTGDKGNGSTFRGCISANDVVCDPAKVIKQE
jgi:hypothetical protein